MQKHWRLNLPKTKFLCPEDYTYIYKIEPHLYICALEKHKWQLGKDIKTIAQELGKLGGEATKKKLGKEHFKRISKLGVKARKHETD